MIVNIWLNTQRLCFCHYLEDFYIFKIFLVMFLIVTLFKTFSYLP